MNKGLQIILWILLGIVILYLILLLLKVVVYQSCKNKNITGPQSRTVYICEFSFNPFKDGVKTAET